MSDEDEVMAAELALGLIEGDERSAAERRQASDPGFAEAVERWRAHTAIMLDGRDEAPRPSLWAQIEARLPANDVTPARSRPVRRWQAAALGATAAAVVLAFLVLDRRPPPIPPPGAPLVAMLTGAQSRAVVSVSFDPLQGRLTLSPAALDPGRHSAELWVIPADKRPRSLGVIDPTGSWRRAPAAAAAIAPGVTLAVSIEPVGGSPSGQPTGPVVLSGVVREI